MLGLGQLDAAQRLADDLLHNAQQKHRTEHQAVALNMAANIARGRHDDRTAVADLEQSIAISEATGFVRQLAEPQASLAEIYRAEGNLVKAEQFAKLAAASTQASGDPLAVPQRLQTLAQIEISRGHYAEADRVYDRADAFIDSMVGSFSSVLEKIALIRASSEAYSQHFALIANRFNDPAKAYGIVEQVRGRVATDLLMDGSVASSEAKETERTISQLQWGDIDWSNLVVRIRRSSVEGRVYESPKTEESRKPVPLDPDLAQVLSQFRQGSSHGADSDFVFAGDRGGPRCQGILLTDHIKPAAAKGRHRQNRMAHA